MSRQKGQTVFFAGTISDRTLQGQDSNSQEANASLVKLLGNCNGNVSQIPTDTIFVLNTPVTVHDNSSVFDIVSSQAIGPTNHFHWGYRHSI